MIAERVSGTRSAHITTQRPGRFLSGVIKHLFREAKACLAQAPQPRRKKRGGDTTQRSFARTALEIGTLARALFLRYLSPAFDEGLRIHLWHENHQHDGMTHHEPRQQAAQNYLSPHL